MSHPEHPTTSSLCRKKPFHVCIASCQLSLPAPPLFVKSSTKHGPKPAQVVSLTGPATRPRGVAVLLSLPLSASASAEWDVRPERKRRIRLCRFRVAAERDGSGAKPSIGPAISRRRSTWVRHGRPAWFETAHGRIFTWASARPRGNNNTTCDGCPCSKHMPATAKVRSRRQGGAPDTLRRKKSMHHVRSDVGVVRLSLHAYLRVCVAPEGVCWRAAWAGKAH
jgi:hypothetical protein